MNDFTNSSHDVSLIHSLFNTIISDILILSHILRGLWGYHIWVWCFIPGVVIIVIELKFA